jgi:pimeloyl-ACP methyl ester carboxylesterase
MAQNEERRRRRLTMPVLSIAGALSSGALVESTMRLVCDQLTSAVLDGCGHYPAEEQPERFLELLTDFLS